MGSLERRLDALQGRYPYGEAGTPMGGGEPLWAVTRPYGRRALQTREVRRSHLRGIAVHYPGGGMGNIPTYAPSRYKLGIPPASLPPGPL